MAAALPKSLRADWTDAPELEKECHLGEPKAESPIRIANIRTVDMISVTPVRVCLLEPAETCDVPVRWSCRTGVHHTCETGLVAGTLGYWSGPVDAPADGHVRWQPEGDVVIDL